MSFLKGSTWHPRATFGGEGGGGWGADGPIPCGLRKKASDG